MNVPYTTPLKDASQSSFVYAGKIKVRYFLNSGLYIHERSNSFNTIAIFTATKNTNKQNASITQYRISIIMAESVGF
jgi:hypothetical protein